MAVAAASCCFSALSSDRRLNSSYRAFGHVSPLKGIPHSPRGDRRKSSDGTSRVRKYRSADLKSCAAPRKETGKPKEKEKVKEKEKFDSKEMQVDSGSVQETNFLDAVVKVYGTHAEPDYGLPWNHQRQDTSYASAFMIGGRKLLTNAHCVEHCTRVKLKKRGDDTAYVAKEYMSEIKTRHLELIAMLRFDPDSHITLVCHGCHSLPHSTGMNVLTRGVDCDLALLAVESKEFWEGVEPLKFGHLPRLQDAVTVVGYPLGGDTISVTEGVVSRIEVTSYSHGSSELLGIQIDAAINPGNSGGPAFNDQGDCIGVAFQVLRSDDVENIGYVIPSTVVLHFLKDYERNGKYTGFPSLGVLLQKMENPALREFLHVPSNEGLLVRRVEPTSKAIGVLKEGDVIVSFDGVRVGYEGTVPFRSSERIAFRYLISQKFTGDVAELGIIRGGSFMTARVVLSRREYLVPFHMAADPSYIIIGGFVFTTLSEPLIDEEYAIGVKLLAKARYSMSEFRGEQIVILSLVLTNEVNIGYDSMCDQQVLKFNGTRIKNIRHLARLFDSCKDKHLVFEFDGNILVVMERKAAQIASATILKDYRIPSARSPDL